LSNFAKKFESKNKVHIWQFTWCTSQPFFKLHLFSYYLFQLEFSVLLCEILIW
jgi:hypothetical protein